MVEHDGDACAFLKEWVRAVYFKPFGTKKEQWKKNYHSVKIEELHDEAFLSLFSVKRLHRSLAWHYSWHPARSYDFLVEYGHFFAEALGSS